MKTQILALALLTGAVIQLQSAVRYVDANSAHPTPPYTNWATAASVIQDAVDAANPGDQVLVTNGLYATGGRPAGTNVLANRVTVDKPLQLISVNGPEYTIIQGRQVPDVSNGDGAIRCVYLANGAMLSGFTLTNGATRAFFETTDSLSMETVGGGLCCESAKAVASNCVLVANSAYLCGGGAYLGTLNDCIIVGNLCERFGGGVNGHRNPMSVSSVCWIDPDGAILNNCVLIRNVAYGRGGGAVAGTLNNCLVSGNAAVYSGDAGGTLGSSLNYCIVSNNYAPAGGGSVFGVLSNCLIACNNSLGEGGGYQGAGQNGGPTCGFLYNCTVISNSSSLYNAGGASGTALTNCILIGNSAGYRGGAVYVSTLDNCKVTGNSAGYQGGGAYGGALNNCTVANNWADAGGGVFGVSANNSIVYANTGGGGANYASDGLSPPLVLNYCCTIPLATNGIGNITNEPLFIDLINEDLHLQFTSPCINSGNNRHAVGLHDLEGNSRIVGGTVDIGVYEFPTPVSRISYAWLQQYGLPIDSFTDNADPDNDGMSNWREWIAGTDPTNPASLLMLYRLTNSVTGTQVTWQSINTRTYCSFPRCSVELFPLEFRGERERMLNW